MSAQTTGRKYSDQPQQYHRLLHPAVERRQTNDESAPAKVRPHLRLHQDKEVRGNIYVDETLAALGRAACRRHGLLNGRPRQEDLFHQPVEDTYASRNVRFGLLQHATQLYIPP